MLIWAGLAALAIVLAAAIYVLATVRRPKRTSQRSRRPEARLDLKTPIDMLGYPALHDVVLPEAHGGTVRIEHMIRLPSSILIVSTTSATLSGEIKGHEASQTWTIRTGDVAAPCHNPLSDLKPLVSAFRRRFPLLRVRGLIIFPDAVSFPDDAPSGALCQSELGAELEEMLKLEGVASPTTEQAWNQISRVAGGKGHHSGADA